MALPGDFSKGPVSHGRAQGVLGVQETANLAMTVTKTKLQRSGLGVEASLGPKMSFVFKNFLKGKKSESKKEERRRETGLSPRYEQQ